MQLNKPSIPGAVVGLIDQQQKRPNFILVVLKILICQHIAEIILFHGFFSRCLYVFNRDS